MCVCVSVCKSVSTVFLDNRDRFELQTWMFSGRMLRRETKSLERGSPGKLVKRAGATKVSVR